MSDVRRAAIYSGMCYRDATGAIAWLGRAFGFEPVLVVPGPEGTIAHAELRLGEGIIMLGSFKPNNLGMQCPREVGGVTQSLYIATEAVEALYQRAVEAGAEVVNELRDTDYGSREFSVRDPEGHLWHVGTYRPGQESPGGGTD
jgi:uncharacterized glyoxalase superfamily protein PhnB